jgi:hypothetical protein
MDLRDSKVTYGTGEPPHIDNSYCFVRGDVNIPMEVDYSPITVKHITLKETNIRATGQYRASYTIRERDYMIKQGATFSNETWYNIETKGLQSPLGEVAEDLVKLRLELLKKGDSAEYLAKTSAASIYGITFEATNTFVENDQLEVTKNGFRGGEFLNPLFAAWICAETRIQMSEAAQCVANNGGKPVLLMTDCVFWEGEKSALDSKFIRDTKTLGYFETPEPFSEMACLGSGRYSYKNAEKNTITTKNRGLNIFQIHDKDGIVLDNYNWLEALEMAKRDNSLEIEVKVRVLISVGIVAHNNFMDIYDEDTGITSKTEITANDLGRVVTSVRKVNLISGLTKRLLVKKPTIDEIANGSIKTDSLYYSFGMAGDGKLVDQTLPILREEVMKLDVRTAKKRDLANRSKASYKYNKENKETILAQEREKYKFIKNLGYTRQEAKRYAKRSWERIHSELLGVN